MSSDEEEILHELCSLEPMLAKRVIEKLENEKIPFEVEADHSALNDPVRALKLYFFMSPEGSKAVIFVPESYLDQATALLKTVIPE
ncbi:MAG: hypothetical protein LBV12_12520 [Puniceicoccales bacterium]|jgi:hypothetical protein|nr:hypothetical protein [Puniceicoccales bacterium]